MNIRQEMNTHGLNYIWNLSYLDNRVHSMIKERMLDTFKQLCPSKVTTTLKGIPHQHLLIEFKLQTIIIKNCFNTSWEKRMNVEKEKDYLETLDRTQQVIIFRVRTGHCRLLSHLYRLRLAHTDECPCGTDSQTPEHILQSCPSHNTLRQETWPYPVDLYEKLWGPTASLRRTADFLVRTGLDV